MWPPWPPGMATPPLWHGYHGISNVPTLVHLPLPSILHPGPLQPTEDTPPVLNHPTMLDVTHPYPKPQLTFWNPDEENDMLAATLAAIMGDQERGVGTQGEDSKPEKKQGGKQGGAVGGRGKRTARKGDWHESETDDKEGPRKGGRV